MVLYLKTGPDEDPVPHLTVFNGLYYSAGVSGVSAGGSPS